MTGAIAGMIDNMTLWQWWVLAVVLLVLELLTGTTYLLWIAAAAAATGVAVMGFDAPWQVQLLFFAVFSLLFTMIGRRFLQPGWLKSDSPGLNEGAARVVGRTAVAIADFAGQAGRVRLDDTVWPARAEPGLTAAEGDTLLVTGMDSATLLVSKPEIEAAHPS